MSERMWRMPGEPWFTLAAIANGLVVAAAWINNLWALVPLAVLHGALVTVAVVRAADIREVVRDE